MASKKTDNKQEPDKGKTKAKAKNKAEAKKRKEDPPVKMIIRRNAAPKQARAPSEDQGDAPERQALTARVEDMGGSHVAAGIAAGTLGNVLGVIAVGQGWVSPKITAGLLMGSGAATMAAGWYWEWDHVMAAGAGMTTAGAFSMTNQLAVDTYEAMEAKSAEKRKKREEEEAEKERRKRLADARAMLEADADKQKQRNGRRIVILGRNGEPLDADLESYEAA